MLLSLINDHYHTAERERRGIVESMRLMADEARALALEAHAQSAEHLQVILDHIKDVVLPLDEDGVIRTFNPTGERVFGYAEAEVIGQRIDLLLPQLANGETISEALQRLRREHRRHRTRSARARAVGAAQGRPTPSPRKSPSAKRRCRGAEMFVLCLRDVTERRESEQAVRENEAALSAAGRSRPRSDRGARRRPPGASWTPISPPQKLFGLERAPAARRSDPWRSSPAAAARRHHRLPSAPVSTCSSALEGGTPVFEWSHKNAAGREIVCEVRLVRPAERELSAWCAAVSPTSPSASATSAWRRPSAKCSSS